MRCWIRGLCSDSCGAGALARACRNRVPRPCSCAFCRDRAGILTFNPTKGLPWILRWNTPQFLVVTNEWLADNRFWEGHGFQPCRPGQYKLGLRPLRVASGADGNEFEEESQESGL